MKLREIIADAKDFSKQASDNTRWLAAGGLAVVWVLAEGRLPELRRPAMALAAVGFVCALIADFLHYARATKKLVALIERSAAAGAGFDSPVELTSDDVPASRWFTWKTRCLIVAFLLLAWAFVMRVFPEAGEVARATMAALTK